MMQKTVTTLLDDLDGSEAHETVVFSIDGKTYEIDLSEKNAAALRKAVAKFVEAARPVRAARPAGRNAAHQASRHTLFSTLTPEEKEQFREWANKPKARRIPDDDVREWIESGKP